MSLRSAALVAYLTTVALLSAAAFAATGWDKLRAKRDARRVPERTLHLLAAAGGWPGALLAQRLFRHKTRKTSFRIVFWLTVAAHVTASIALIYAFA